MEKLHRLSVEEASEILGTTPDVVRRGISQKELPIGKAISNGSKNTYLIYEETIEAFVHGKNGVGAEALDKIIDFVEDLKTSI